MKPSVGRIVHYVSLGSADGTYPPVCRAAIVAGVPSLESDLLQLVVLNPEGLHFVSAYANSRYHDPGTWHWPERED